MRIAAFYKRSSNHDPEPPLGSLLIRVLEADGLPATDRNGLADPYVKIRAGPHKKDSDVIKETLTPVWKNAALEAPLSAAFLSQRHIEVVVWDRDTFTTNDYIGEVALSLSDLFPTLHASTGSVMPVSIDNPLNKPIWHPLVSSKARAVAQGRILIHAGFRIDSPIHEAAIQSAVEKIVSDMNTRQNDKHARIMTAPPTEGVGTTPIASRHRVSDFSDDEASSSEEDVSDYDYTESDTDQQYLDPSSSLKPEKQPTVASSTTPSSDLAATPTAPSKKTRLQSIFRRSPSSKSVSSSVGTTTTATLDPSHAASKSAASSRPESPRLDAEQQTPKSLSTKASRKSLRSIPSATAVRRSRKRKSLKKYSLASQSSILGVCFIEINKATNLPRQRNVTRTGFDMDPFVVASFGKKVFRTRVIRHSLNPVWDERLFFRVHKDERNFEINFSVFDWDKLSANDYVGDATLLLSDLLAKFPPPDPSTGMYATTQDGQLQGDQVQTFQLYLTEGNSITRSPSSSNISSHSHSPAASPGGGNEPEQLSRANTDSSLSAPTLSPSPMPTPTSASSSAPPPATPSPSAPCLTVKAKFVPYAALRQQFWRAFMTIFDTDDSMTFTKTELLVMLDSLGSTLTPSTIKSSFFARFNKDWEKDELTFDEVVRCLEAEISKTADEKKRVTSSSHHTGNNVPPVIVSSSNSSTTSGRETPDALLADNVAGLQITGHMGAVKHDQYEHEEGQEPSSATTAVPHSGPLSPQDLETVDSYLQDSSDVFGSEQNNNSNNDNTASSADATINGPFSVQASEGGSMSVMTGESSGTNSDEGELFERVINIDTCPICHKPPTVSSRKSGAGAGRSSSNRKSSSTATAPTSKKKLASAGDELDIVTHMALCASKDWTTVGNFIVSNFVTSDQAQRKWVTKAIKKISSGQYQLGANSANIIVQDRKTGRMQEEKMQVYVRLGIRLLYKGMGTSRMESNRIRSLLRSMSIKQGIKYDSPDSVAEIAPFIVFHNLNVDEILNPISSFKTFNEFFYRKLKPDARPVADPDDPGTFVSCADCRMVAFQTITEATELWIKGREFSIKRLLGDEFASEASRYEGGSLAIFRLAPQDYHRYHSPVDGVVRKWSEIDGEYYTVNPMAVRSQLDLYGENIRRVMPVDSPTFGRVMNICIGAMMVGSIIFTVKPGDNISRGQEYGYFAFGGSTIVTLIEPGKIKFDQDILENSEACIESLVSVGERVGVHP